MTMKESWFTEQLEFAAKKVSEWPEWARREAGIDSSRLPNVRPVNDNNMPPTNATTAPQHPGK